MFAFAVSTFIEVFEFSTGYWKKLLNELLEARLVLACPKLDAIPIFKLLPFLLPLLDDVYFLP
jgi:hypothetical protein